MREAVSAALVYFNKNIFLLFLLDKKKAESSTVSCVIQNRDGQSAVLFQTTVGGDGDGVIINVLQVLRPVEKLLSLPS